MFEKLSFLDKSLDRRQKIIFLLILLTLLLLPITLLAIKKRADLRGRAQQAEDPRIFSPATIYLPFFPVGKAEKVVEGELDTGWRNSLEIFNLAGKGNKTEIKFYNQAGEQESKISADLAPHASKTIKPQIKQECLEKGCLYSAIIESSYAVSAVANLVREAANQYSVTSYKGIDSREIEPGDFFPAVVREKGYNQEDVVETELVFFNPSEKKVNLTMGVFSESGSGNAPEATLSASLKPKETLKVNTKDLKLPFPFRGSAQVAHVQPFSHHLAAVVLIQSDKRLYSYTTPPYSTKLYIPAVHNQPVYGPLNLRFDDRVVIQNLPQQRQLIKLKFVEFGESPFETTFEIDPGLSHYFDLSQHVALQEGAVIIEAEHPISALMIKENSTYWGDIVIAQAQDNKPLFFPFIARNGSSVPTKTQMGLFNPHEGPLNLTFASFSMAGEPIRRRSDDLPRTLWAKDSQTVGTAMYLQRGDRVFNQGSLSVYSEIENKGVVAVVEGVREMRDSRALLAGDAFFSYEGQRLFGEPLPTLTPTPAIIIPDKTGCVQSPAYTGDLCNGYRLITSLESDPVCYETMNQCLPNQGEGTCVKSPTYNGDVCEGYRVMPGISRACYSFEKCQVLLSPTPTKPLEKCPLNGDYDHDGDINMDDFKAWQEDFKKGKAELRCFEYWRRGMYDEQPIPTFAPASSAFFSLVPSRGYFGKGEGFGVEVHVDTGGQKTTSADAWILFDSRVLEVDEIVPGDFYPGFFKNIVNDQVYLGGAVDTPKGAASGEGVLGKIIFKGKYEGTSSARFNCTPGSTVDSNISANDPNTTDIIDCSKNVSGTYTISDASVTPTPAPCENNSCDVNSDGQEDSGDYSLMVSSWRQPLSFCPRCDLNCDGSLNAVDIMQFTILCPHLLP